MSTELTRQQFRKRLAVAVVLFGCLSLLVSLLLLFDGPRVRKVVYDSGSLPRDNNQTIILRSNQPLQPVAQSQISIEPKVDFTVTAAGEAVVIQLKKRLNYNTDYVIRANNLTAKNGRTSKFETTIRTDAAEYYVLKRNFSLNEDGQPASDKTKKADVIKQGAIDTSDESIAFEASKILDYAALGDRLVVQTLSEKEIQKLAIYDIGGKNEQLIDFPEEGSIEQLAVSNNQRLIGFIFTSTATDDGLPKINKRPYIYDTKANQLIPIRGVGSDNLAVHSWQFHPDSTSLIIQTIENTTFIVDSYGKENPLPIGTYFSINDISDNGTEMVVGDIASNGPALLTLKEAKALPYAQQKTGSVAKFISEVQLLQSNEDSLQVSDVNEKQNQKTYRLYELVSNDSRRRLFEMSTDEGQALQSYVSKNDQYLAIEVAANTDSPFFDSYPVRSLQSNVRLDIIDTESGKKIKETSGFKLTWR